MSPEHLLVMCAIAAISFFFLAETAACSDVPQPSSPAAAKRFDKWIVIGPGGGGAQFHPAVSPHDPMEVLDSTDMSEAYISHDGGESWRMFNVRGHIRAFGFAWDPINPKIAYLQSIGLFRTIDGCKTWQLVFPSPSNVDHVAKIGDHAFEKIVTRDGSDDQVLALAIDPADSRTLYAVMSSGSERDLCVSTDFAETWKKEAGLPTGAENMDTPWRIWIDPSSPRNDRTVYIAGTTSLSIRQDGKWTHRTCPQGVHSFSRVSLGFDKAGKPVIYATSGPMWRGGTGSVAGVWVSQDAGASWTKASDAIVALVPRGAEGVRFQTVETSISQPDVAYVAYKGPRVVAERRESYAGVAKTTDRGRTWQLVWLDTSVPAANVMDAWMNDRFGPEWGDVPFAFSVAPSSPDIVYATDFGRTMRTTDGGKTWKGVYSRPTGNGGWTTTGLDMPTCYGVQWDPFDPKRMFIDYTDIGLFASDDGGTSWNSATAKGVPEDWVNTTYWMVFDPEVKGRAWAVMSGVHDLPFPKMWNREGIGNYTGGIVATSDSGKTWSKSSKGMPETAATDIILDPRSPKDARVLYVAGLGTGFWKSSDGGATWSLKNRGIVGSQPFAWRIVMDAKGALYGVVARRSWDGRFGDDYDGALYRSTDGAETWERITLPDRVTGPHGIAIDPEDTKRLYLAVWGLYDRDGDTHGGIFLSEDAGASWRNVFDLQQHIYDVIIDPSDSNVLYAGSMTFAVWRSGDRGATWRRIKGYNFKQANRVVIDPYHKGMIYVTTFGGSVWYGPGEGDPKAVEDVTTPEIDYTR